MFSETLAKAFELDHGSRKPIRAMEGLRGLAVLLVFFVHYVSLAEPWLAGMGVTEEVAWAMRRYGNAGVDLFFVLSGFLIYGALIAKPRPFIGFMRRRVARIYPTFLVVLGVYVVLSYLRPEVSRIPEAPGDALIYLVQNVLLLPGIFPIEPIITVSWSLSYELFYYLLIPLVIGVLRLRAWGRRTRVVFFSFVGVAWLFSADELVGGHARLVMFVAGILLKEALDAGVGVRFDWIGLPALAASVVAVLFGELAQLGGEWRFGSLFLCYFLLCLASFGSEGRTARVFSWTPLRWLGNMSYSYYLGHALTLSVVFLPLGKLAQRFEPGAGAFWLFLGLTFGLTLVTSAGLFLLVERPASLGGGFSLGAIFGGRGPTSSRQ